MNDPMWDLAYLSNEAALDPDGERALAAAYFGREPGDAEIARIKALKPAIDILSALWALIQHAQENRAADFAAVAAAAFARAADRMRSKDFPEKLKAVAEG